MRFASRLLIIAAMPRFPYDIAVERDEPYPPVDELPTIEADDAMQALEQLKRQRIVGESGIDSAWLRVVVTTHPNGLVRQAITRQVPLVPVLLSN